MALCGVLFASAAFLPGMASPRDGSVTGVFWLFSPFWIAASMAAIYFFRYRVVITRDRIAIRSIRERAIDFGEVVDVATAPRQSKELLVYLKDGQRLRFSGLLQDYGNLKAQIESNLHQRPGPSTESPARLMDEARRQGCRGSRTMGLDMRSSCAGAVHRRHSSARVTSGTEVAVRPQAASRGRLLSDNLRYDAALRRALAVSRLRLGSGVATAWEAGLAARTASSTRRTIGSELSSTWYRFETIQFSLCALLARLLAGSTTAGGRVCGCVPR